MNVFVDGIQIFTTIAVDSVKQHALLPLVLLLLPVPLQLMMKRRSRGQSAARDHED
ncbi:hypothetical protein [Paraburkholderia sp. PGU19]|uniref:hypothetical protein n=1 Tax=Paraburkholderia sp. PGU19 TaxID=2735434 RepID=UPI0015D9AF59|nr:hypothetical protein [Paraburkholderia sp. PGU19]